MEETSDQVHYTPLYLQVKDLIHKKIVDGLYLPGSVIPSETVLAKTFGTSISTIRQAINLLVADEILNKRQGKGTFVAEKKVDITFMSWICETPRGRSIIENLISRFEAKNPGISVKLVPTTYTDAQEDLLRLITHGKAPDVAQIVSPWTTYFASMGAFVPLEEYLSKQNLECRFFDKDIVGGIYNDKVYSVAWGLCPMSLIVNKTVLKETHTEIPKCPVPLTTFEAICAKISDTFHSTDKYCYGLNVRHDETDFLRIYTFLQAFGGGFIDDRGEVVFNSEQNYEGFSWLKKFIERNKIYKADIYSIREKFARNDIAFITDGPWIKYILEELTNDDFDKNFKVILNPTWDTHYSYSWNYNHALAMCSQSNHKFYAGRFIDQITNDPELSHYYFSTVGHLHTNKHYLEDSFYQNEFFKAFREQLKHSKCINAQNAMFEKAMVLCMDAVKKILFDKEVEIEKELNEKEYYLNMLYYG